MSPGRFLLRVPPDFRPRNLAWIKEGGRGAAEPRDLNLGSTGQVNGTYGGTSSGAGTVDTTYFSGTGGGVLNVAGGVAARYGIKTAYPQPSKDQPAAHKAH